MTARRLPRRWLFGCCGALVLSLAWLPKAALASGESAATNAEIIHLMGFIRASKCEFLRNGSWHASDRAYDHIQRKLDYIRDRDLIRDGEQFIEQAASRSSLTGEAYQVRCPGAPMQECRRWLLDELHRFRKSTARTR